MATMVTFSLTAVYAQSAVLRLREYYMNQGKNLPKQDSRKTLRHISTIVLYIISWYVEKVSKGLRCSKYVSTNVCIKL